MMRSFWKNDKGITGLETAIVLIAFVVVAAVFAFAVLTTGLLSSEQSKEEIIQSLEATSSTLQLRGSIIGRPNPGLTQIDTITFQVTNSAGGGAVNLANSGSGIAVVTYIDENQSRNLSTSEWAATWLVGSGNLLETGERVEFTVTLTGLSTPLGTSSSFKIEVKPLQGAVLNIDKATPAEFNTIVNLN
ncbi:MAG: hypothetical protein O2854_05935 [Chloroflexi bacterium]|nr:hypothetical protein [Chloroflexota bacterium]